MSKQHQKNISSELAAAGIYEYVKHQFDMADPEESSLHLLDYIDDDYLGYSDLDQPDADIRDFISQH